MAGPIIRRQAQFVLRRRTAVGDNASVARRSGAGRAGRAGCAGRAGRDGQGGEGACRRCLLPTEG